MAYMLLPVYNIDRPVGKNKPNITEDVKLVQTQLLEMASLQGGWMPNKPINATRSFDDATGEWIKAFQKRTDLYADGVIDPMPVTAPPGRGAKTDWHATFPSGATSTMYALNIILRLQAKGKHEGLNTQLGIQERLTA